MGTIYEVGAETTCSLRPLPTLGWPFSVKYGLLHRVSSKDPGGRYSDGASANVRPHPYLSSGTKAVCRYGSCFAASDYGLVRSLPSNLASDLTACPHECLSIVTGKVKHDFVHHGTLKKSLERSKIPGT